MDFSVTFLAVTKVRQPSRGHVVSQGVFVPHLPKVGHTERWVKSPHWNFDWFGWLFCIIKGL